MPWWGILLTVIGTQAVFLLVVWLLIRKKQPTGTELVDAERSKVKRLQEEAEAAKEAATKITDELKRLADENKKLQEWYNGQKDNITKEARDAFSSLATDPAELDRRLDALLGTARSDPTVKP